MTTRPNWQTFTLRTERRCWRTRLRKRRCSARNRRRRPWAERKVSATILSNGSRPVAHAPYPEPEAGGSGAFLSFSGDAEEDEPVDLFGQASKEDEEESDDEDGEGDDEGEPEDDFNAAWEVLDLARALYEKQQEESDEIKLKLAETYITLGDVSLETGMSFVRFRLLHILTASREIRPGNHRLRSRP